MSFPEPVLSVGCVSLDPLKATKYLERKEGKIVRKYKKEGRSNDEKRFYSSMFNIRLINTEVII